MKSLGNSKFGLTVQSSGKGAAKRSIDPEMVVTPTSGQIKINDATSRMLQVASRENIVLLGNRRELEDFRDANPEEFVTYLEEAKAELVASGDFAEDKDITIDDVTIWGIAKGWGLFSKSGAAIMVSDRLTKAEKAKLEEDGKVDKKGKVIVPEVQSVAGFRVAANGSQSGVGHIMTGNDTANYALLGGNGEENVVYSISRTPEILPMDNGTEVVDVKVYMLDFDRKEAKLRGNDKVVETVIEPTTEETTEEAPTNEFE